MKKDLSQHALVVLMLLGTLSQNARAAGNGVSGGLTFLDAGGARASALGEAFSAVGDDANAFLYNPASLTSLSLPHASLYYRTGEEDERHGRFTVGTPAGRTGYGFSIASYDSGTFQATDGVTTRSVTAQSDLAVALGGAVEVGPVSVGLAGKYLSSELVETAQATAFAVDVGIGVQMGRRLRLGAAVQNVGGSLRYVETADPLPRLARFGFAYQLPFRALTTLSFDLPYFVNEEETRPSLALETFVGPLALRAGARRANEMEYSFGAGFALNRVSFDYAMAASGLDARHEAGVSFRFGHTGGFRRPDSVRTPSPALDANAGARPATPLPTSPRLRLMEPIPAAPAENVKPRPTRVYVVQPGDTLSTIAKRLYGNADLWTIIVQANRHLMPDPSRIEVGQRLVVPE